MCGPGVCAPIRVAACVCVSVPVCVCACNMYLCKYLCPHMLKYGSTCSQYDSALVGRCCHVAGIDIINCFQLKQNAPAERTEQAHTHTHTRSRLHMYSYILQPTCVGSDNAGYMATQASI